MAWVGSVQLECTIAVHGKRPWIPSDRDDGRIIFRGFKFFLPVVFGVGKFGKNFLCS